MILQRLKTRQALSKNRGSEFLEMPLMKQKLETYGGHKNMNNFEQNLEKLEKLSTDIKRQDISLEDALKDFEEGIKLAKGMEKQLDEIEGKIQILMNEPVPQDKNNPPQLELFEDRGEVQGTRQ